MCNFYLDVCDNSGKIVCAFVNCLLTIFKWVCTYMAEWLKLSVSTWILNVLTCSSRTFNVAPFLLHPCFLYHQNDPTVFFFFKSGIVHRVFTSCNCSSCFSIKTSFAPKMINYTCYACYHIPASQPTGVVEEGSKACLCFLVFFSSDASTITKTSMSCSSFQLAKC